MVLCVFIQELINTEATGATKLSQAFRVKLLKTACCPQRANGFSYSIMGIKMSQ
jgi:hypothetical protein